MSKDLAVAGPKNEVALIFGKITDGLKAFEERKATFMQLVEEAGTVKITTFEDKAPLKKATEIRKKIKAARVEVQKEGKSMREPLTAVNREISAKEGELVDIVSPAEKDMEDIEDWYEAEKERLAKEEQEKENLRIQRMMDILSGYGRALDYSLLKIMTDEQFEEMSERAKIEHQRDLEEEEKKRQEEQAAREQQERDRAELKALREKQEAADKILREREEEIKRKERELEKKQEEDRARIVSHRVDRLNNVRFDGHEVYWKHNNTLLLSGWDSILDLSEEEYAAFVVIHNDKNESALHEIYLAEEQKKKEEEEKRQQQLEQAKKEAAEKALAEQKEREAEAKRQEEEKLAKASDKDKIQRIVEQFQSIAYPEMKSASAKKLVGDVKDMTGKIISHIKAKA